MIREILPGERANFNSDADQKSSVNECKLLAMGALCNPKLFQCSSLLFSKADVSSPRTFSYFARDISSAVHLQYPAWTSLQENHDFSGVDIMTIPGSCSVCETCLLKG